MRKRNDFLENQIFQIRDRLIDEMHLHGRAASSDTDASRRI